MTLDMIFMLLTDRKCLRAGGRQRVRKMDRVDAASILDKDGLVKARASDGTAIKLRMGGKSKVQMLKEKQAKERAAREKKDRRQRRMERRRK